MAIHQLSAVQVANAKPGEKLHDGAGLFLRVTDAGSARWVFRYTAPDGKRREQGLGRARGAGAVTLAAARKLAAEGRALLAKGIDPLHHAVETREAAAHARAAQAAIPTFQEAATRYIDRKEGGWRNEKHRQQWRNTISTYCAPISGRKVDRITVKDVVAVLTQPITDTDAEGAATPPRPLWIARPETARRLRGRIENILRAEIAAGHASGPNPAGWRDVLEPLLPALPEEARTVRHQRALPYSDVGAFVAALRERQPASTAALAAEFLTLTAARTSEVLAAVWREFDMDAPDGPVWTVPASRMKAKRAHTVPLPPRAVALLEQVKPLTSGAPDAPVFPSPARRKGQPAPMSNMALLVLLDRMGWRERTTMHGLRSAFRDWSAAETNFPREVCEAALAHQNADRVEAAYLRGDHLAKRRKLMAAWLAWIERGILAAAKAGLASDGPEKDDAANMTPSQARAKARTKAGHAA